MVLGCRGSTRVHCDAGERARNQYTRRHHVGLWFHGRRRRACRLRRVMSGGPVHFADHWSVGQSGILRRPAIWQTDAGGLAPHPRCRFFARRRRSRRLFLGGGDCLLADAEITRCREPSADQHCCGGTHGQGHDPDDVRPLSTHNWGSSIRRPPRAAEPR